MNGTDNMNNHLKLKTKNNNLALIITVFSALVFINIQPLTSRLNLVTIVLFTIVSLAFFLNFTLKRSKLLINKSIIGFWILPIFFVLSLMNTLSLDQSIKYIVFYMIVLLVLTLLANNTNWFHFFLRCQFYFALVHAIITFVSYFFTDFYIDFFTPMLNESARRFTLSYIYNFNLHSGIAGQTGTNAFYLSTGLAISFSRFFGEGKQKKIHIVYILFFVLAIFMTGKRGFILANFLALVILYYYHNVSIQNNNIKRILKYVTFIFFITIGGYFAYLTIPTVNLVIDRFFNNSMFLTEDISSGRFDLYKLTWNTFLDRPLLGVGIDAFTYVPHAGTYSNAGAHNELLQFLAEIGILGTSLFAFLVLAVLKKTIYLVKSNNYFQQYKPMLYASLYTQVYLIIHSFVGMPFRNYSMLLTYMIFAAIPYAAMNKNRLNKLREVKK